MVCYENQLVEKLRSLDTKNQLDFDLINKAIDWAKKYHDGQFRKSGEPFYTHPLQVAYLVSDYKLKTDVIVASILHDIIEDTEVTTGMLVDHFSWRIAEIVDRLTRDRPDGSKLSVEEILNNAYPTQDKEVLLIKVLDRLHNMQTLGNMPEQKQKKKIRETLDHFIVFSMHLSLLECEYELANLCLSLSGLEVDYTPLKTTFSRRGNYQLPAPDFQNEINQLYSLSLQEQ